MKYQIVKYKYVNGVWTIPELTSTGIGFGISDKRQGNMCLHRGNHNLVKTNRISFFKQQGIDYQRSVMPKLEHSNNIKIVRTSDFSENIENLENAILADGIISQIPNSTLLMDTADCLNLIFWDEGLSIISLVHAGWRSTDKKIAEQIVTKISKLNNLEKVRVLLGIGICSRCYVVNQGQSHPLLNNPSWFDYLSTNKNDSISINIAQYNIDQLIKSGIEEKNIYYDPEICTMHSCDQENNNIFCSHRRATLNNTEDQEGRFFTYLHLPENKNRS